MVTVRLVWFECVLWMLAGVQAQTSTLSKDDGIFVFKAGRDRPLFVRYVLQWCQVNTCFDFMFFRVPRWTDL